MMRTKLMRGIIAYFLAAFFLLYEMSVQSSPSVMALSMMRELSLNPAVFGTVMGCYFYSYSIMQIPSGLLFDRFSSKNLIIMATLACSLGSLLFSVSHSIWSLAGARFITGFGSAFAFVGVLVIADQWFEARFFPILVGIAQLLAALGAMVGEMPLAYWVNHLGWSHTSFILSVIGLLLMLAILLGMRSTKPSIPLEKKPIKQSLKHIFNSPQTFWVALYAFCSWAPITIFAELWGVPYLINAYGMSSIQAPLSISIIWIALALFSPFLGWYSQKTHSRKPLLQYCALIGLIAICILLFIPHLSFILIYLALAGLGFAAAGQILSFALVKDNNQECDLAAAIGFNNMAVVLGGAFFQPLTGFLLHEHASLHTNQGSLMASDYRFALLIIPICYVIGYFCSRHLIREPKRMV